MAKYTVLRYTKNRGPVRMYIEAQDEQDAIDKYNAAIKQHLGETEYTSEAKVWNYEEVNESVPLGEEDLTKEERRHNELIRTLRHLEEPIWTVATRVLHLIEAAFGIVIAILILSIVLGITIAL